MSAQKAFLALATSLMEERFLRWLTGVDLGVSGVVVVVVVICCWSVVGWSTVFDAVKLLNVRACGMLVFNEIHGWSSIWSIDGLFLKT